MTEAVPKTAAPNSFRAECEGFLTIMGLKLGLASDRGFPMVFGGR